MTTPPLSGKHGGTRGDVEERLETTFPSTIIDDITVTSPPPLPLVLFPPMFWVPLPEKLTEVIWTLLRCATPLVRRETLGVGEGDNSHCPDKGESTSPELRCCGCC